MSRLRYACRRDANEPAIIQALEAVGATVESIDGKPYDLIVGYRRQNFLLEVKTAKGTMKESQQELQKTWRGQYAIVRTTNAALSAIGAVTA